MKDNGRDGDRRPPGELPLERVEARLPGRMAVAVAVGVDDDLHEVRVVNDGAVRSKVASSKRQAGTIRATGAGRSRACSARGPGGRAQVLKYHWYQWARSCAAEAGARARRCSARCTRRWSPARGRGRGRRWRRCRRPGRPSRSRPARRAAGERVDKVEEILADGRLLGHARRRRLEEAGRAVAPQVRRERAIPGAGERRSHIVPRACIVRKAVHEDDGKASRINRAPRRRSRDRACGR